MVRVSGYCRLAPILFLATNSAYIHAPLPVYGEPLPFMWIDVRRGARITSEEVRWMCKGLLMPFKVPDLSWLANTLHLHHQQQRQPLSCGWGSGVDNGSPGFPCDDRR